MRASRLMLAGALVAATWPAWRFLVTAEDPIIDELLQLRCSSSGSANSIGRPSAAPVASPADGDDRWFPRRGESRSAAAATR